MQLKVRPTYYSYKSNLFVNLLFDVITMIDMSSPFHLKYIIVTIATRRFNYACKLGTCRTPTIAITKLINFKTSRNYNCKYRVEWKHFFVPDLLSQVRK